MVILREVMLGRRGREVRRLVATDSDESRRMVSNFVLVATKGSLQHYQRRSKKRFFEIIHHPLKIVNNLGRE